MCLSIPKKVVKVLGENIAEIKNPDNSRQKIKTIIKLKSGDFVLSQGNVAIQKITNKEAKELLNLLKESGS